MKISNLSAATVPTWQQDLSNLITDAKQLATFLQLDEKIFLEKGFITNFPLRVTPSYAARIKKGDPNDPLLLQILPLALELQTLPNFSKDPLQEQHSNPVAGMLHKYRDRVLLTPTGACAIHCRYCFRRHFPYTANIPARQSVMDYLTAHTNVKEVILSGGDPLMLKDHLLQEFITQLAEINHIKRLRIHSRLPIVLPSRITSDLIAALNNSRLKPVIVVHSNHANEINEEVRLAIQTFTAGHIPVFNQSVLLKNINDTAEKLIDLSEALFDAGIIPYYLHLLDKVDGAAHFEVNETVAKQIIKTMLANLPGYLVPKLVREKPGAASKVWVDIDYDY